MKYTFISSSVTCLGLIIVIVVTFPVLSLANSQNFSDIRKVFTGIAEPDANLSTLESCLLHFWVNDGGHKQYKHIAEMKPQNFVNPPASTSCQGYSPRHGDLIRARGDSRIYLIQAHQHGYTVTYEKRHIVNEHVFFQMGFRWEDLREVEYYDLMAIPEGKPITVREFIAPYPEGTLLRLKGTNQVYVIQGGRKCYIPDFETFQAKGYGWDQVIEVEKSVLDQIVTGIPLPSVKQPVRYHVQGYATLPPQDRSSGVSAQQFSSSGTIIPKGPGLYYPQTQPGQPFFPDGTLIKGPGPEVFLIENGMRRLIPDMETFQAMGFNHTNVISVDSVILNSLPVGIPLPNKRTLGR